MKIVKFKNGGYGIRTGWIFHRYVDLAAPRFQWMRASEYFQDCISDNKDEVMRIYDRLTDKGTPVGDSNE